MPGEENKGTENIDNQNDDNKKPADGTEGENNDKEKEPKTYHQKDVDALVGAAVKKAREEAVAEAKKQALEEAKEQKRLETLSAEEKAKEAQSKLEAELKAYKDKEAYSNALSDTKKELEERKLPLKYAELLVDMDPKKALENIKNFETQYKADIQAGVEERLKADTTPKTKTHQADGKEQGLKKLQI